MNLNEDLMYKVLTDTEKIKHKLNMEHRIKIEEVMKRYKVSERTLQTWKETNGLTLREVIPQNKWVKIIVKTPKNL